MAVLTKEELNKITHAAPGILQPALPGRFRVRIIPWFSTNVDHEMVADQTIGYKFSYDNGQMYLSIDIEIDCAFRVLHDVLSLGKSSHIEIFAMDGNDRYYSVVSVQGDLDSLDVGQSYSDKDVMTAKVKWKVGKTDIKVVSEPVLAFRPTKEVY